MKKIKLMVGNSILLLFMLLISCSNEDFVNSVGDQSPIKVARMDMFIPKVRGISDEINKMPVLQFKDEVTFNMFVKKLEGMSENERIAYMKNLGFVSAEQTLKMADEELERIFDYDNEDIFKDSLADYRKRYQNILAFDTSDVYDVTPYLPFNDSIMKLVGNIKGFVVIGNNLIGPKEDTPNFLETYSNVLEVKTRMIPPGAIEPGFRSFQGASLTIKNGKYKSTMTLGRIVNGNSFAIEFVTKKKQFLWKKKVRASYSLNLEMISSKFQHRNFVRCPEKSTVCILNLPIEFVGNTFTAKISDFKSSRGSAIGSAEFTNIKVR